MRPGIGSDFGDGRVSEELALAVWAHQFRASPGLGGWESVDDDVLNPVGIVTGTAVVLVPGGGPAEWYIDPFPFPIRVLVAVVRFRIS